MITDCFDHRPKGGIVMKKLFFLGVLFVVAGALFVGCAGMSSKTQSEAAEATFTPQPLQTTCSDQKTNNFLVLLDASGSMGEKYKGQTKYKIAEQVVSRMNQTIPGGMTLNAAVRTFGAGFSSGTMLAYGPDVLTGQDIAVPDLKNGTTSVYGPASHMKSSLEDSLGKVNYGGYTPIGVATSAGGEDVASMSGTTAVILVSDGKQNAGMDAIKAAQEVKNRFGDKLCFYTVLVGDDPAGKELMDNIAGIGQCGFSTTADAIYTSEGMANFVGSVFCSSQVAPVVAVIADSDGDGIADDLDKCPNTPKGATVNSQGCWAYQGEVLFDFDKAQLKSGAYPILDEGVTVLENNPGLNIEIQGYTDSTGAEDYNLKLSQKRADSVMDFLVSRGIDPGRLSAKGYGSANPVASNDTAEGRAKNRRVEFRAQ
jgi:OOP family OmpA-OmpF porin